MGILTPLSANGLITMSMGMVFFKPQGSSQYEELGIVEPLAVQCEFEDQEIFDPRSGQRVLVQQDTTKTTVTVNATMKMLTARNRALSLAADLTYEDQVAVTAGSFTVNAVTVGGIYHIGKLDLSNVSADDGAGAPVAYTPGTHYKADVEAGLVQILAKPGAAGANFVMTYDAAAIAPTALRLRAGIGSKPNLRGALIFRGTNDIGVKSLVKLHDCQLRPSGERQLVTEEYTQVEVTGRAFADTSQSNIDEQFGFEATLS